MTIPFGPRDWLGRVLPPVKPRPYEVDSQRLAPEVLDRLRRPRTYAEILDAISYETPSPWAPPGPPTLSELKYGVPPNHADAELAARAQRDDAARQAMLAARTDAAITVRKHTAETTNEAMRRAQGGVVPQMPELTTTAPVPARPTLPPVGPAWQQPMRPNLPTAAMTPEQYTAQQEQAELARTVGRRQAAVLGAEDERLRLHEDPYTGGYERAMGVSTFRGRTGPSTIARAFKQAAGMPLNEPERVQQRAADADLVGDASQRPGATPMEAFGAGFGGMVPGLGHYLQATRPEGGLTSPAGLGSLAGFVVTQGMVGHAIDMAMFPSIAKGLNPAVREVFPPLLSIRDKPLAYALERGVAQAPEGWSGAGGWQAALQNATVGSPRAKVMARRAIAQRLKENAVMGAGSNLAGTSAAIAQGDAPPEALLQAAAMQPAMAGFTLLDPAFAGGGAALRAYGHGAGLAVDAAVDAGVRGARALAKKYGKAGPRPADWATRAASRYMATEGARPYDPATLQSEIRRHDQIIKAAPTDAERTAAEQQRRKLVADAEARGVPIPAPTVGPHDLVGTDPIAAQSPNLAAVVPALAATQTDDEKVQGALGAVALGMALPGKVGYRTAFDPELSGPNWSDRVTRVLHRVPLDTPAAKIMELIEREGGVNSAKLSGVWDRLQEQADAAARTRKSKTDPLPPVQDLDGPGGLMELHEQNRLKVTEEIRGEPRALTPEEEQARQIVERGHDALEALKLRPAPEERQALRQIIAEVDAADLGTGPAAVYWASRNTPLEAQNWQNLSRHGFGVGPVEPLHADYRARGPLVSNHTEVPFFGNLFSEGVQLARKAGKVIGDHYRRYLPKRGEDHESGNLVHGRYSVLERSGEGRTLLHEEGQSDPAQRTRRYQERVKPLLVDADATIARIRGAHDAYAAEARARGQTPAPLQVWDPAAARELGLAERRKGLINREWKDTFRAEAIEGGLPEFLTKYRTKEGLAREQAERTAKAKALRAKAAEAVTKGKLDAAENMRSQADALESERGQFMPMATEDEHIGLTVRKGLAQALAEGADEYAWPTGVEQSRRNAQYTHGRRGAWWNPETEELQLTTTQGPFQVLPGAHRDLIGVITGEPLARRFHEIADARDRLRADAAGEDPYGANAPWTGERKHPGLARLADEALVKDYGTDGPIALGEQEFRDLTDQDTGLIKVYDTGMRSIVTNEFRKLGYDVVPQRTTRALGDGKSLEVWTVKLPPDLAQAIERRGGVDREGKPMGGLDFWMRTGLTVGAGTAAALYARKHPEEALGAVALAGSMKEGGEFTPKRWKLSSVEAAARAREGGLEFERARQRGPHSFEPQNREPLPDNRYRAFSRASQVLEGYSGDRPETTPLSPQMVMDDLRKAIADARVSRLEVEGTGLMTWLEARQAAKEKVTLEDMQDHLTRYYDATDQPLGGYTVQKLYTRPLEGEAKVKHEEALAAYQSAMEAFREAEATFEERWQRWRRGEAEVTDEDRDLAQHEWERAKGDFKAAVAAKNAELTAAHEAAVTAIDKQLHPLRDELVAALRGTELDAGDNLNLNVPDGPVHGHPIGDFDEFADKFMQIRFHTPDMRESSIDVMQRRWGVRIDPAHHDARMALADRLTAHEMLWRFFDKLDGHYLMADRTGKLGGDLWWRDYEREQLPLRHTLQTAQGDFSEAYWREDTKLLTGPSIAEQQRDLVIRVLRDNPALEDRLIDLYYNADWPESRELDSYGLAEAVREDLGYDIHAWLNGVGKEGVVHALDYERVPSEPRRPREPDRPRSGASSDVKYESAQHGRVRSDPGAYVEYLWYKHEGFPFMRKWREQHGWDDPYNLNTHTRVDEGPIEGVTLPSGETARAVWVREIQSNPTVGKARSFRGGGRKLSTEELDALRDDVIHTLPTRLSRVSAAMDRINREIGDMERRGEDVYYALQGALHRVSGKPETWDDMPSWLPTEQEAIRYGVAAKMAEYGMWGATEMPWGKGSRMIRSEDALDTLDRAEMWFESTQAPHWLTNGDWSPENVETARKAFAGLREGDLYRKWIVANREAAVVAERVWEISQESAETRRGEPGYSRYATRDFGHLTDAERAEHPQLAERYARAQAKQLAVSDARLEWTQNQYGDYTRIIFRNYAKSIKNEATAAAIRAPRLARWRDRYEQLNQLWTKLDERVRSAQETLQNGGIEILNPKGQWPDQPLRGKVDRFRATVGAALIQWAHSDAPIFAWSSAADRKINANLGLDTGVPLYEPGGELFGVVKATAHALGVTLPAPEPIAPEHGFTYRKVGEGAATSFQMNHGDTKGPRGYGFQSEELKAAIRRAGVPFMGITLASAALAQQAEAQSMDGTAPTGDPMATAAKLLAAGALLGGAYAVGKQVVWPRMQRALRAGARQMEEELAAGGSLARRLGPFAEVGAAAAEVAHLEGMQSVLSTSLDEQVRLVNSRKFDLDPHGVKALESLQKAIVARAGDVHPLNKPITHDMQRQMARQIGMDRAQIDEFIKAPAQGDFGAKMLALRDLVSHDLNLINAAYDRLGVLEAVADPTQSQMAMKQDLLATITALQGRVTGAMTSYMPKWSQVGRDLNTMKLLANRWRTDPTTNPIRWVQYAQKVTGGALTDAEKLEIARLAAEGDRDALLAHINSLVKTPAADKVAAVSRASLLLGFSSPVWNIASQIANQGFRAYAGGYEAALDAVVGAWSRRRTIAAPSLTEWRAQARGLAQGIREMRVEMQGGQQTGGPGGDKLDMGPRPLNFDKTALDRALAAVTQGALTGAVTGALAMKAAPGEQEQRWGTVGTTLGLLVGSVNGARAPKNWLQLFTNVAFRAVGAPDRPFYGIAMAGSLANQATALARMAAKSSPREVRGHVFHEMRRHYLLNPTEEMTLTAAWDGAEAVFRAPGTTKRAMGALRRVFAGPRPVGKPIRSPKDVPSVASDVARYGFDLTLPFTGVPSSIYARTVEGAGFGVLEAPKLLPLLAKALQDGDEVAAFYLQRRLVQASGRAMAGASLVLYGAHLAGQLNATGAGPADESVGDKNRKKVTGEAPRGSIRVTPSLWVNAMRFPPVGLFLAAGAAMREAHDNPDINASERIASIWAALSRSALEMPMLLGVKQMQEGLADPARRGSAFIESAAKRLVPAEAQRITKYTIGNQIPDPKGPFEALRATLPGGAYAGGVATQLNALGEPVRTPGGFWGAQVALPATRDRTRSDPFMAALAESRFPLGIPARQAGEPDTAYQRRRAATGATLGELLRSEYQQTGQLESPDSLGGNVRARVRDQLMDPLFNPELRPRIDTLSMSPLQRDRLRGSSKAAMRKSLFRMFLDTPEP